MHSAHINTDGGAKEACECVGRVRLQSVYICEVLWRWHNADLRPFMLSPGGWRFVEKGIASVRVRGNWSSTKVKRVVNFQDFLFISGNFQTCKAFAPYVDGSLCTKSQLFARIAASMAAVVCFYCCLPSLNCLKYDKF
jgi:hypothetical protein